MSCFITLYVVLYTIHIFQIKENVLFFKTVSFPSQYVRKSFVSRSFLSKRFLTPSHSQSQYSTLNLTGSQFVLKNSKGNHVKRLEIDVKHSKIFNSKVHHQMQYFFFFSRKVFTDLFHLISLGTALYWFLSDLLYCQHYIIFASPEIL